MDIGRLISVAGIIGGSFYAGFKFNDYLRKRRDQKIYEDGLELLKEEIKGMEKSFHDAADSVKKTTKERFEALMKRVDHEIYRPEYIAQLRNDIRDFVEGLKPKA